MKSSLLLGIKLLMRQWQGGMVFLLSSSFIVCIALMSGMNMLSSRIGLLMQEQASTLMGADLILSSSSPIAPQVVEKTISLNLTHTSLVEFLTMTLSGDEAVLASVKALNEPYPLVGKIILLESNTAGIPAHGELWLHKDWQERLNVKLEDKMMMGEKEFVVTHFYEKEPEIGANIFKIAPGILMNHADLEGTAVIQPGSRVTYQLQMIGEANAVAEFIAWVKPRLTINDNLVDYKEDRPELAKTIDRAQRYSILTAFASVVLAGTTILLILREYTQSQEKTVSLLRTFGVKQTKVFAIYFGSLLCVGCILGVIGTFVGFCLQEATAFFLEGELGLTLPGASFSDASIGLVTALILITGFSLPSLSGLVKQSPVNIFHAQNKPPFVSKLFTAISVSAVLGCLLSLYTENLRFSLITLFLFILIYLFSRTLLEGLILALQPLKKFFKVPYKLSLSRLSHQKHVATTKMLGLSLSLTLLLLLTFLRFDLLSQWQKSFPVNPPNHYAFNILPSDVTALRALLDQKKLMHSDFFPIVKARLMGFDNFPPGEEPNYLKRELNNTALDFPRDIDKILEGEWWAKGVTENLVSVEKSIAETLNLKVGQTLNFTVADKRFSAKIANIREVNWENFQPNFYMIFSEHTLAQYPETYLTSLHVAHDRSILKEIAQDFPSVTVISVEDLLKQAQRVVNDSTITITALLLVILLSSVILVFTTERIQLQSRTKEVSILIRLGVRRDQLFYALLLEYLITSLLVTALSFSIATLMVFSLSNQLFHSGAAHLPLGYFPSGLAFIFIIQLVCSKSFMRVIENPK